MQGCSRRFCRKLWKAYQSTCFRCQTFSWSGIASWYIFLMGKIASIGSTLRRYVFPKHRAVFGLVLHRMTHVNSLFGVVKSYLPVCHEDGKSYEFTITCGLPKPWISGKIIITNKPLPTFTISTVAAFGKGPMCTHAYMYEDDKKLLVGNPPRFQIGKILQLIFFWWNLWSFSTFN